MCGKFSQAEQCAWKLSGGILCGEILRRGTWRGISEAENADQRGSTINIVFTPAVPYVPPENRENLFFSEQLLHATQFRRLAAEECFMAAGFSVAGDMFWRGSILFSSDLSHGPSQECGLGCCDVAGK